MQSCLIRDAQAVFPPGSECEGPPTGAGRLLSQQAEGDFTVIEIQHLKKTFPTPDGVFTALEDVNLTIRDGDVFGIVGMSGAGKSTLVRCINLLERPTSGQVLIAG